MKGLLGIVGFTLLTAFCWGIYGPVVRAGQLGLEGSEAGKGLRAFICVGLAYFVIAVIVPIALLRTRGEGGAWTMKGTIWSLAAGAAGALGALGIVLAFAFQGKPVYVMPLVFGTAPVVNTFVTMYMSKTYKQAGPVFFAGLILVIVGAVTVLMFKPGPKSAGGIFSGLTLKDLSLVLTFVTMTGLAWGAYGPVLHKGQMAMQGSRLRPLLCVGLAYFLIAVLVPAALIALWQEPGGFKPVGTMWSLGGGAAGAVGALGIIMAFNSGGKPIYVMPLVFGLAPVINTFASILSDGSLGQIGPLFYAGLLLVVAGAVTVLIFAPKAHPSAVKQHAPPPAKAPAKA